MKRFALIVGLPSWALFLSVILLMGYARYRSPVDTPAPAIPDRQSRVSIGYFGCANERAAALSGKTVRLTLVRVAAFDENSEGVDVYLDLPKGVEPSASLPNFVASVSFYPKGDLFEHSYYLDLGPTIRRLYGSRPDYTVGHRTITVIGDMYSIAGIHVDVPEDQ